MRVEGNCTNVCEGAEKGDKSSWETAFRTENSAVHLLPLAAIFVSLILFFTLELFQKCYIRHYFMAESRDRTRFPQIGISGVITKLFKPNSIYKKVIEILGCDN
ncbi:hypothetical protein [Nostoc sp. FACHB-133]|uniref:hypothetical protein n=1 Tax=Nostoc sp. FACHB-133 TaxID=2692835 RepID=UPI001A7E5D9E|nr:hypothetical protein [Nostoc sp. FACHB-133]